MTRPPSDATARDAAPRPWRSLAELEGSAEAVASLADEFPFRDASAAEGGPTRRDFLKLMGAGAAATALAGCDLKQPPETIVPYVEMPERLVPGRPLYFATAFERDGVGLGLIAESHEGRPTKIEGNPDHPSTLGATDPFCQAETLTLYDPRRARAVADRDKPGDLSTLAAFKDSLAAHVRRARERRGAGLHLLTGAVASPTLNRLISELLDKLPEARRHVWEPAATFADEFGAVAAFGRRLKPVYRLDRAEVVVSLDADFLAVRESPPVYARQFMSRRRLAEQTAGRYRMNRLFAAACTPSLTWAKADEPLTATPAALNAIARELARRLDLDIGDLKDEPLGDLPTAWLDAAAADLRRAGGNAVVLAGPFQMMGMHAIAHAINAKLGAVGKTVDYVEPNTLSPSDAEADADYSASLHRLVTAMGRGEVETLLILGGNPVYDAPPDLKFGDALAKVPNAVRLGLYRDETAERCRWHVPRSHPLEAWGDTRGHDGAASIIQPLIAPLYQSLSEIEVISLLLGGESGYDSVRATWRGTLGDDFDRGWHEALQKGVITGTASKPVSVAPARFSFSAPSLASPPTPESASPPRYTLIFRPDPGIWDGRYVRNGWLQELPRPLTLLTWGNAALMAPADAKRQGLTDGDVVRIAVGKAAVELPALRSPGHPAGCVTLHLGFRGLLGDPPPASDAGNAGGPADSQPLAADVNPLRSAESFWSRNGATLTPAGRSVPIAVTQTHFLMEGEHLVRGGTLEELKAEPKRPTFAHPAKRDEQASLYPAWKYDGRAWGMTVDLTSCTGCGTCVVACDVENNVPVVGRGEVLRHREMHWLRVDVYHEGSPDAPARIRQQPVPCMHCELAPCEPVCPVAATVHSGTGLNQMVYNRCVGTRYCSNNCPYKVRHFNFLAYGDRFHSDPALALLPNPDVTVRSRGVMEKCTYCVQRIQEATIAADRDRKPLKDGTIVTACQQACPTEAIVFGDVNDPASAVSRKKSSPLNYALLEELGTRPRTTYLAEVRNPAEP